MSIPYKSMDEAMKALDETIHLIHDDPCVVVEAILKAASPGMYAQALREQLREFDEVRDPWSLHYTFELTDEIRARADELEGRKEA